MGVLVAGALAAPFTSEDDPPEQVAATSTTASVESSGETTTTTPETTTTDSSGASTTTSAPAPDELTGYGATREAWDATHQQAEGFTPGAAYHPLIGGGQPQYATVCCDDQIISYTMFFPKDSTKALVMDAVRREFPGDATPGELVDRGGCETQEWRSPSVEATLDGYVPLVALFPPDPTYPPDEQLWQAIFTLTEPNEPEQLC